MNFSHSSERQLFADTANRFLANRYDFEARQRVARADTGFDRNLWRELCDLGLIGALFPEAAGGFGGSGFDIMVIFEAVGKALSLEPFLASLMAGTLLRHRPEILGAVIAGEAIVTFAHFEAGMGYGQGEIETRAARRGDKWTLSGTKGVVPFAKQADWICVSAIPATGHEVDAGPLIFLLPTKAPGVVINDYPLIDGGRAGELTMDGVVLSDDALLLVGDEAAAAIEVATAAALVAICAEAIGIMDYLRDATLEYLRTRIQFSTPIGKFQALQHRMATVALEIEQARSALINAADGLQQSGAARQRALSAAKYTIGRVGTLIAEEAIQLHGGIGMTWELPLSHYAKRLIMIDHELGDQDHHLERYSTLS